jgi:hypothetical protein
MTEHSYLALGRACFNRLTAAQEMWGNQVGEVPHPAWTKPYVQLYYISGGERNQYKTQDAEYQLGIKVVGEDMEQALMGAARISELLNDQGVQDRPDEALDGGDDWEICTATQGRMIHLVERFSDVQNFYHEGHVFSFVLGRN